MKDNNKSATKEKPMGKRQIIFFLPPLITKVLHWAQKVHQMVVQKRKALRKSDAVSNECNKITYCFNRLSICYCVSVNNDKPIEIDFDRMGTVQGFCTRVEGHYF